MIARSKLPPKYAEWNRHWSAPYGRPVGWAAKMLPWRTQAWRRGPFAWQDNSRTREFEFPWAHDMISRRGRAQRVLEIGGGLSGLQFVLGREGHRVVNVDPGQPELGWRYRVAEHKGLADVFDADVELFQGTIDQYSSPDPCDVILCISALEHFDAPARETVARAIPRLLRPGGLLVLSVDLFLDLIPFSTMSRNEWGENVNVRDFLARCDVGLHEGNPSELYGYPEFDPLRVMASAGEYLLGGYPVVAQCIVARRPD